MNSPDTFSGWLGVLIVDDQPAVRDGLARLMRCGSMPLRCVTTASNGREALAAFAQLHHDVVVLDVDLGGEDGLALMPRLTPSARVLVLTSHGDSSTRARARALGASAFIEKHQPAADLLGAMVALANLQTWGEEAPAAPGPSSLPEGVPSSAAAEAWRS